MKRTSKLKGPVFVVLLLACIAIVGLAEQFGSQDHPLVPRMQGFTVGAYDAKDLDEYVVPLGPLLKDQPDNVVRLEGKVTKILYNAQPRKSVLEIARYYEDLLRKNGFEILYRASARELGNRWSDAFYAERYEVHNGNNNQKFISAKLPSASGDVYVTVYATLGWMSYATTEVDIIEPAIAASAPAVTLASRDSAPAAAPAVAAQSGPESSALLEEQLKTDGFALIKSIEFKEGSAEIKPGSETVLRDMAAIVKRNPARRFEIKVYTDSNGTPEYCRRLSATRADSVMRSVVLVNGADRTRVKASGMGFSPEEGKGEAGYSNRVVFSLAE